MLLFCYFIPFLFILSYVVLLHSDPPSLCTLPICPHLHIISLYPLITTFYCWIVLSMLQPDPYLYISIPIEIHTVSRM